MSVDGFSVLVFANEDGVVVLGILIDESVLDKAVDDLSFKHSIEHQLSVHSTHIRVLFGKFKRLLGLDA